MHNDIFALPTVVHLPAVYQIVNSSHCLPPLFSDRNIVLLYKLVYPLLRQVFLFNPVMQVLRIFAYCRDVLRLWNAPTFYLQKFLREHERAVELAVVHRVFASPAAHQQPSHQLTAFLFGKHHYGAFRRSDIEVTHELHLLFFIHFITVEYWFEAYSATVTRLFDTYMEQSLFPSCTFLKNPSAKHSHFS